jgi:hypothetical protein
MVLTTKFPPDIRVEKEARALSTEYEVHLLCPKCDGQAARDTWETIRVRRVFNDLQRLSANSQLMTICASFGWSQAIASFVRDHCIEACTFMILQWLGLHWPLLGSIQSR